MKVLCDSSKCSHLSVCLPEESTETPVEVIQAPSASIVLSLQGHTHIGYLYSICGLHSTIKQFRVGTFLGT